MGFIILGAGGLAREVFWNIRSISDAPVVFVDDYNPDPKVIIQGISYPVVTDWDFSPYQGYRFLIGVGSPNAKRAMVKRALDSGIEPHPTLIHPKAVVQDAIVGMGGVITSGCVVTTNIRIGDYVVLNLNCTVGHDTVIGDYVQANPGCHISGNVVLEEGVSLGTGTAVIEGTRVSKDIVTGAQAAVVRDLLEAGTYVGVPAKKLVKTQ